MMIQSDTVLFDINETVLDMSPLKGKFEVVFADKSALSTWFSMLLHTSTVCSLTDIKSNFSSLAKIMLSTLAAKLEITLTDEMAEDLLNSFANLPPHPDIKPALTRLNNAGIRTVAFSNSSNMLIKAQIDNAGLTQYFDQVISVEACGRFKPDYNVYQFAANCVNRPIESLWLVATHDWDTHGAISAGMRGAYINRFGVPYHTLYLQADIEGNTMLELVDKIIALNVANKHQKL